MLVLLIQIEFGVQGARKERVYEMTHDELLAICDNYSFKDSAEPVKALRAVVELAMKPIDASDTPAEQVAWFYEGYSLAMDNVLDAIEKKLG